MERASLELLLVIIRGTSQSEAIETPKELDDIISWPFRPNQPATRGANLAEVG